MMMITPGIGRPCQQDVNRRSGPADDGKDGGGHQGDHDHQDHHDHNDHDDHVDDDNDDQKWGAAIKCDHFNKLIIIIMVLLLQSPGIWKCPKLCSHHYRWKMTEQQ